MTTDTAGAEMDLPARLREYTAMRYMGNCKCGNCQLVPRQVVDEAANALTSQRKTIEALTAERDKWKIEAETWEARAMKAWDSGDVAFTEMVKATLELVKLRRTSEELADAMHQCLDDMGIGVSVCGAAKAQARIAIEPFLNEDRTSDALMMTLLEAQEIAWDCDRHNRGINPYRVQRLALEELRKTDTALVDVKKDGE